MTKVKKFNKKFLISIVSFPYVSLTSYSQYHEKSSRNISFLEFWQLPSTKWSMSILWIHLKPLILNSLLTIKASSLKYQSFSFWFS